MEQIRKSLEGTIDFEGQELADKLETYIELGGAVLAGLIGFACQDILYSLYGLILTFIVTELVVVPPWPFYRKTPITWQNSGPQVSL